MAVTEKKLYRLGIDVGGTNTDAVLACLTQSIISGKVVNTKIIAKAKSPTTVDVTSGICEAIKCVLDESAITKSDLLSVNIGTTCFLNAVIQADSSKLNRVAVLRLCGPFCRQVSPFESFPSQLRAVVEGHVGYLKGGLEIDGRPIHNIDEEEVKIHAKTISDSGLNTVVVIGTFSSLDMSPITQEQEVRNILEKAIPGVDVVCSSDIGRIGFLERENASVLNASILETGRLTIRSFQDAIAALGLECDLFLTQNDGTIMSAQVAQTMPIKTFASGATNSLMGAIFLSGIHESDSKIDLQNTQVIMVDMGGTSSDFAALTASGFPRESRATVDIAGVRTAFSMPEVLSIGLGGGSLVHEHENGEVTVGPTSVGHTLNTTSQCFGGSTMIATDIVVASGFSKTINPSWNHKIPEETIRLGRENIKQQLQRGVDYMKTSDMDVVLLLVGGGSIIQMDDLNDVKQCLRPPFYDVANAVGAAIAKVSGEVDTIEIPNGRTREQMEEDAKSKAVQIVIANGANPDTVKIVEVDTVTLPDSGNHAVRIVTKAIGELGCDMNHPQKQSRCNGQDLERKKISSKRQLGNSVTVPKSSILSIMDEDLESYIPKVSKATGEWFLSQIDLAFISDGCGVLGTGGGGAMYSVYMNSVEVLRSVGEGKMRIIEPQTVPTGSQIVSVVYVGSPAVAFERLPGEKDLQHAVEGLAKYINEPIYGVVPGEVGGGSGMQVFSVGANMDLPIIDADNLGRAYPRFDLSLPFIYDAVSTTPAVFADCRNNVIILAGVESSHRLETLGRTISVELGSFTGFAHAMPESVLRNYCCHGVLSSAWYMGRDMYLARQRKTDIVQSMLANVPGGKLLYSGKIGSVVRKIQGGHTTGSVTIIPFTEAATSKLAESRPMTLLYQNEYLYAALINLDGSKEMIATTPDLISILDQDGTALSTPEIRYGLRVSVVALPVHPLWFTPKGLKAGSPRSFGIDEPYVPLGTSWAKPKSVIQEFGR